MIRILGNSRSAIVAPRRGRRSRRRHRAARPTASPRRRHPDRRLQLPATAARRSDARASPIQGAHRPVDLAGRAPSPRTPAETIASRSTSRLTARLGNLTSAQVRKLQPALTPDLAPHAAFRDRHDDPVLVNIKPDIRDTCILRDGSPHPQADIWSSKIDDRSGGGRETIAGWPCRERAGRVPRRPISPGKIQALAIAHGAIGRLLEALGLVTCSPSRAGTGRVPASQMASCWDANSQFTSLSSQALT
jgi:hypothetical protein